MQLSKKILLTATAMAFLSPFAVHAFVQINNAPANLTIDNSTPSPSTVQITNETPKLCSGDFPNGVTNAGDHDHKIAWILIKGIFCKNVKGDICDAQIYTTTDCDKSGTSPIGIAHLNMTTGEITTESYDTRYTYTTSTGSIKISGPQ